MSFVPSLRECLHRLDRVRDTALVAAALDALNAEMWSDEPAIELTEASRRLIELHQLCLHLAANMSGGAGIPPTPLTKGAAAASTALATPPITSWTRTASPPIERAAPSVQLAPAEQAKTKRSYRTPVPPAGHIPATLFAKRLGVSMPNFYHMVGSAVPAPSIGGGKGNPSFWSDEQVAEAIAARSRNPRVRAKPPTSAGAS